MVKYPFYELAARRTEIDGSVRRCFRASDHAERALFVWQGDDEPVLHAQLLLGDEAFVEWRATRVTCGMTNRASGEDSADSRDSGAPESQPGHFRLEHRHPEHLHARHKGVRTLVVNQDEALFARARLVLQGSDLPSTVVDVLLARLQPNP